MTSKWKTRIALNLALFSLATAAAAAPKEAGIWYDDTGKGAVRIEPCGEKLCGRIHWLKEPLNAEGKPLRDKHNPNASQQNRPICGLQVIGGLAAMQDGEWDTGWIYDPKEGKSYSVALKMADPNTLKVTGYLVMKMMGRTLTWTRAPADLPSCTANAAAPSPAAEKVAAPKPTPPPSKVAAPLPAEETAQAEPVPAAAQPEAQTPPPAVVKKAKKSPQPAAQPSVESDPDVTPAANAASPAKSAAPKAKPESKKAAQTGGASGTAGAAASDKKTKGTKAAKSKEPEQLPWAKKEAPAAGASAPSAEAPVTLAAPVVSKPRPVRDDDQARPFQ